MRASLSPEAAASRWSVVAPRSFDAADAAARWGTDVETAREFIHGPEGFLERGLCRSLNGSDRMVVTQRGLAISQEFGSLGPEGLA